MHKHYKAIAENLRIGLQGIFNIISVIATQSDNGTEIMLKQIFGFMF